MQPAERMATRSSDSQTTTPGVVPFCFLDLPAELRAAILALAARHTGTALLKRNSRGVVSSSDPLSFISKQVRGEYLGVLYEHAQTTLAYVLDFDFRHVVTYLNKLNKAEVKALPTQRMRSSTAISATIPDYPHIPRPDHMPQPRSAQPGSAQKIIPTTIAPRPVKLVLNITFKRDWQSTFLLRWLDRLKATNKIGFGAQVSFASPRWGLTLRWPSDVVGEQQVQLLLLTLRQKEEVARIFAAVRNDIVNRARSML